MEEDRLTSDFELRIELSYEDNKMIAKLRYAVLTACLTLVCLVCLASRLFSIESHNAYISEYLAIERAAEYLGLDRSGADFDAKSTLAMIIHPSDDKSPMVANKIIDRDVWEITFHDVAVGRDDTLIIHPFWVRRDFTVLIDPADGQLLSVYSVCDSVGSSDTLPEPPAEAANEYLAERDIRYVGVPDSLANVPLLEAFRSCMMREPAYAKVVRAIYVDYSTSKHAYPHRWLIILRGTDKPMMVLGPDPKSVPLNQRNALLFSVDAKTGKSDFMINAPYDLSRK